MMRWTRVFRVILDNFGDIFAKFNRQEVQRLRTVLQTNTSFRIFGASSKVLEAFYDNRHPFFEFFKVKRLTGLNKEETIDLLLKANQRNHRHPNGQNRSPAPTDGRRDSNGGIVV